MTIENYKRIWGSNSNLSKKHKKPEPKKESIYDMKRKLATI